MSFELQSPPTTPGLYAIVYREDELLYVGKSTNLRQRRAEWLGAFNTHHTCRNKEFTRVLRNTNAADWRFHVLEELPGITHIALGRREAAAIVLAQMLHPGRVLNGTPGVPREKRQKGIGDQAKSTILDGVGGSLGYTETAEKLGISKVALSHRLIKLRRAGHFTITLLQLSDHYKKLYKKSKPIVN